MLTDVPSDAEGMGPPVDVAIAEMQKESKESEILQSLDGAAATEGTVPGELTLAPPVPEPTLPMMMAAKMMHQNQLQVLKHWLRPIRSSMI